MYIKLRQYCFISIFIIIFSAPCSSNESSNSLSAQLLSQALVSDNTDYSFYNYPLNHFVSDGDYLYILLWKRVESRGGGNADSELAFTKLGENKWTTNKIKGKAFFYKTKKQPGICSVEDKDDKIWIIRFWDFRGNILKKLEHKYKKFKREYHHDIPYPIVCQDGSVMLYASYLYETRNPIILLPLTIISGGHGAKPEGSRYIEYIPPSKPSTPQSNKLGYIEISDIPYSTFLFEADLNKMVPDDLYRVSNEKIGNVDITRFQWETTDINFYPKESSLIYVSNTISISYDMISFKVLASLPPFPDDKWGHAQVDYLNDIGHSSDVCIDNDDNIVYAFHQPFMTGGNGIYIYKYKNAHHKWETNYLPLKLGSIDSLRMYVWREYIYLGIWSYPNQFYVLKIRKLD